MIKYFCDRCGKETEHGIKCIRDGKDLIHMCYDCHSLLVSIKDKIDIYKTSDVEKFCNMSDEDIELLRYTFKVGDKVITSEGLTGVVKEVCTCSECKRRGFYELTVEMEDGSTEWIMRTDQERGFNKYYSIGNRVFGNLDEEYVRKEIDECKQRTLQLYNQLNTIHVLKMTQQHKKKETL